MKAVYGLDVIEVAVDLGVVVVFVCPHTLELPS